jgi:lipoic acid synthetase
MVGLGETDEEVRGYARYARPQCRYADHRPISGTKRHHLPVRRYVHPDVFKMYEEEAYKMGFAHAAVGANGALVIPRRSAHGVGTDVKVNR